MEVKCSKFLVIKFFVGFTLAIGLKRVAAVLLASAEGSHLWCFIIIACIKACFGN